MITGRAKRCTGGLSLFLIEPKRPTVPPSHDTQSRYSIIVASISL